MDQTAEHRRLRLGAFLMSLASYALAVSVRIQRLSNLADKRGCVDQHTLQYSWILLTGVVAGIAAGPWLYHWVQRGVRAFMPNASETLRLKRIKAVAVGFIILGMAVDFLWIIPSLNLFVDMHRPLLVEADVILYGMGTISGASWFALLDRQAWLGLLIMPAMALMIIGSVLSRHGWC